MFNRLSSFARAGGNAVSRTMLRDVQAPAVTNVVKAFYHENVVDHFENPRNVGKLNPKDPRVGSARVGAPACGDVMKLQVQLNDSGVVEDVKFMTFGCGSAIASSSYATEWLHGKSIDQALALKNSDIASHLSLPPVKLHCSMLAEEAVKSAIKDYAIKSGVVTPGLEVEFTKDAERATFEAKEATAEVAAAQRIYEDAKGTAQEQEAKEELDSRMSRAEDATKHAKVANDRLQNFLNAKSTKGVSSPSISTDAAATSASAQQSA